ncbi:hypothetical protein [uncultured Microbacterium sp.]|uniref:ZIP family metal transporter n=1 Tax=uncultured Microbacterium sp. TaxID=191216 RepID=UPI0025F99583|nr:hypothetical protein [uncultured Microbacterium sp.]
MTTAPSLQAVAGRATADARIPPSCPLIGGASREAVKRWAGASRDALLLTLALARWLAACRGGAAIAIGSLIDGIPESVVMGLSVLQTGGLSIPIVAAIAISNIPEGLSSTAAFKQDGSRGRTVALLWGGITAASVLAAVVGYLALQTAPPELIAIITSVAAGALLAMVANTMIPEAFERLHLLTGLWVTLGFLLAFVMHELG